MTEKYIAEEATYIINRNRAIIEQAKQEILQLRQDKAELIDALEAILLIDVQNPLMDSMTDEDAGHVCFQSDYLSGLIGKATALLERMKDD